MIGFYSCWLLFWHTSNNSYSSSEPSQACLSYNWRKRVSKMFHQSYQRLPVVSSSASLCCVIWTLWLSVDNWWLMRAALIFITSAGQRALVAGQSESSAPDTSDVFICNNLLMHCCFLFSWPPGYNKDTNTSKGPWEYHPNLVIHYVDIHIFQPETICSNL